MILFFFFTNALFLNENSTFFKSLYDYKDNAEVDYSLWLSHLMFTPNLTTLVKSNMGHYQHCFTNLQGHMT